MRPALLTLLLPITLLIPSAMADDMQVFDLQGATPQEMIPLIKPFVGPDGTVTGMHNRLIVRTSPERMAEVRKILQEFDRPPRRLLIHVRDTAPSEAETHRLDLSLDTPHLQIGETEKNSLSVKRYTTESREANQRTLQTVEGQPTLISSGIIRPEVTRSGYVIGPGGGYEASVDYRNIDSGFYARVQVVKDRVRIELSTRKQEPISGSPAISHRETENVVSGQLGAWLPVASTRSRHELKSIGIGRYASSDTSRDEEIWVKVELLPE